MDSHLVTIEVSVKGVTYEWVNLNRLTLYQYRLKRLDTETVKRGSAVEKNGMLVDNFLENIPNFRNHRVDHFLGSLNILHCLALNQTSHNERLE